MDKIVELIKNYGIILIALIIILSPIIYGIVEHLNKTKIESIEAKNSLLESQISSFEKRVIEYKRIIDYLKTDNNLLEDKSIQLLLGDTSNITEQQILKLAEFYDLTKNRKLNSHLVFTEEEAERILKITNFQTKLDSIIKEFSYQRYLIEKAENNKEKINNKETLSEEVSNLNNQILTNWIEK